MPEAPEQSHVFGGGATETILSPVVLVAALVVIVLIFVLPRKYVIAPVLAFTFLVPAGQQLYVSGLHLFVLRIVIVAGLGRALLTKASSRKPVFASGLNSIDRAFLYCALCEAICMVLQYMEPQALVNQLGIGIDVAGGYVLLRFLIQSREDIYTALKALAVITAILAIFMVREQMTMQNVFGLLGGVRSVPELREGKIRSQGAFQHALMAGTFAATLPPLFLLLWKNGKARLLAALGAVSCTVMTITSQSSTPLIGYIGGVLAICLWPLRKRMKIVRWGIVGAILVLAMLMKAPVWFVLAHIDLTGGSSGYHRAELIDQFVRHFKDWWLIGTKDAGTWAYDLWDTQNQYVNAGETGGIVAFVLFITMITRGFSSLGRTRRALARSSSSEWIPWLIGAALFAHVVNFFGVNYFDQSKMSWFLLLSMIPVVSQSPPSISRGVEKLEIDSSGEESSSPMVRAMSLR